MLTNCTFSHPCECYVHAREESETAGNLIDGSIKRNRWLRFKFQSSHVIENRSNRCIPPLQVKCFDYLLKGKDIVAVLPTGFDKSQLIQLLPDFVPVKANNIMLIGVN